MELAVSAAAGRSEGKRGRENWTDEAAVEVMALEWWWWSTVVGLAIGRWHRHGVGLTSAVARVGLAAAASAVRHANKHLVGILDDVTAGRGVARGER